MDVIFLLKLIGFGGQRSQPRSEDGTDRPSSAGPVDDVQFVLRSAGYVLHEAERLVNRLDSFYSGKGLSAAAPVVVEQLLEATGFDAS
ncbi:hypothetical protein HDE_06591 [Halotydeus destructor]|nr:hypothetical protein HDE_06591 [Halotydeus destructor]